MRDKLRLAFLLLTLAAAGFLLFLVYRFSHEELMIDRCLSGSHGSFDYSRMECDLETNHPYIPYQARHLRDKMTALVALISFAVFGSGYYLRKKPPQEVISDQFTAKS